MSRAERRSTGRPSDEDDDAALRSAQRSPPPKQRRPRSAGKRPSSSTTPSSRRRKASPSPSHARGTAAWLAANALPTPSAIRALSKEFRIAPAATMRRIALKLVLFTWCIVVVVAILSLLGFNLNPFSGGDDGAALANAADSPSLLSNLAPAAFLGRRQASAVSGDDEDEEAEVDADGNPLDAADAGGAALSDGDGDAVPEMTGYEVKKPVKLNKAHEKQLACEELECTAQCVRKMTPKCAAKKSCRADREKICKRRCLKARCEERCKDEPHYGYVEREQKMDKCKEGCQGNTAAHNKCIKKCHSEYKPCKSRCHEIAARFKCDAPPDFDAGAAAHVEPAGSSSSFEEQDDEEEPASRGELAVGSSSSSLSLRGGVADLDDEVI